ncbi:MAG: TetR/AcrR family transcriptional regulator [Planctomycetota bacterium]
MANDTRQELLDASELLMKFHGYHGFSYANIAERVGIKKASIHHHFAAKCDLAAESVRRYRGQIREILDQICEEESEPQDRLRRFADIFLGAYRGEGSMCLCAALTADWESLPEGVRDEVQSYWDESRAWLGDALFPNRSSANEPRITSTANAIISVLEGALLCARVDSSDQALKDAANAAALLLKQDG